MTYEDILEHCKRKISVLQNFGFSKLSEILQKEYEEHVLVAELIEKQEKYKWHDLRKSPEDLPPCDGDYMCRVNSEKYPERPMTYEPWDLRAENSNQWRDLLGYVLNNFVIAWREIAPLEEE